MRAHIHTVLIKYAYHSLAFPCTLPYSCADAARNVSEAAQSSIHMYIYTEAYINTHTHTHSTHLKSRRKREALRRQRQGKLRSQRPDKQTNVLYYYN